MKYFLQAILFFATWCATSQDYQWGRAFGDGPLDGITNVEVDADDNVYVMGEGLSYYFDLNPGAGTEIIDNNIINEYANICFVVKLDPEGNYVWGKTLNVDNGNGDYTVGLKIGTDNNIYAAVYVNEYFENYSSAATIVKLDPDGNELFTKKVRHLGVANFSSFDFDSFDLDSQNNIFISGYFVGHIALDLDNPDLDLDGSAMATYVIKLDSNGNYVWATDFDYQSSMAQYVRATPDGNASLLVIAADLGTNYETERLININGQDGTVIWQHEFDGAVPVALHVAPDGTIVTSNHRSNWSTDPIDIDPSPNIVPMSDFYFFEFFTPDGEYLDHISYDMYSEKILNVLQTDADNNYYFAGSFYLEFDADPSGNVFPLTSEPAYGGQGICIKFNSEREFDSAFKMGQPDVPPSPYEYSNGFRISDMLIKNDNSYYCGYFRGTSDLDPSTGMDLYNATHNSTVTDDGFVIKLGPCDTSSPNGTADQYFCEDLNPTVANLSPNSATIHWYESEIATVALSDSQLLINGQQYFAARQVGECPESTQRLAVVVHLTPAPVIPVIADLAFCQQDNATVANLQTIDNTLSWFDSETNATQLSAAVALQSQTYYFSRTENGCTTSRLPVVITITGSPLPSGEVQQSFCQSQNPLLGNLEVTGTFLKFYASQEGTDPLPANTALQDSTTYYVSQMINGCEGDRLAINVTLFTTPAPVGETAVVFCTDQNAVLSDLDVTGLDLQFYDEPVGGNILSAGSELADAVTYYAEQNVNGCSSNSRLAIQVTLISQIPAADVSDETCGDIIYSDLSDYETDIIANSQLYTFKYYNNEEDAENDTVNVISNTQQYPLEAGNNTIYVRVISTNGCYKVVKLTIMSHVSPIVNMPGTYSICRGSGITVTAPAGMDSYLWSNGATSQEIVIDQPGNYSLTVGKTHNIVECYAQHTFQVITSSPATIEQIVVSDWTDTHNSIVIIASGNGDFEYSIDGINFQESNTFTNLKPGSYTAYVHDKNDCGDASKDVFLLMYPRFFSPNSDGSNDFWQVRFSQAEPLLSVDIFDRYGKMITQLKANSPGWDGLLNGKELPATDYWFVAHRENGIEYRGHFSLIR